jgi:tetratricopeptide (TPR) repeat protein
MQWKDFDNPQKEIRRLVSHLEGNPQDATAWYDLATAYAGLYDYSSAVECCQKAVELEEKNVLFRAFQVYANLQDGQHKNALGALVKLIELDPDDSDYYVERVIDSLYALDEKMALAKIQELRDAGREAVAHTIERWIWNP